MDRNFIFECSTRYLTRSLRSLVRCRVEHEKRKFISTSGHVIFCLLHKHTSDDVFEDFPKISEDVPKFFEGKANISEHFSDIFRRLPKIFEKAPMMFRPCSNISKYFLRDYVTIYQW